MSRRARLVVAVVCVLAPGAALAAQQGRVVDPVRLEPPGLDFRPDGAWRRRAAAVRQVRRSLMLSGNIAALNLPGRPAGVPFFRAQPAPPAASTVTGTFFVPVVPIAYSDVPAPFTPAELQQAIFTANPAPRAYSLKTFYEEASHGRIALSGAVFPVAQVDTTAVFYEDGCNGLTLPGITQCPSRTPNRLGLLLVRALEKVSHGPGADTLWNRYDNDGPDGLPNSGDDDGVVDFVTFLHPKVGGECRNGATGIWAHRWQIRAVNGGSPYVTQTPRRDAQGNPIPGAFLIVDDYILQSQLGGDSGCSDGQIIPVGTIAHETGHAFGLPDLYDTQRGSSGIGEWGLMGSGNFSRAYSPSGFGAWSLTELGWTTLVPLPASATVVTGPRQVSDTVFFAQSDNPFQFLLIENRQAAGSDTAQMNPDYNKAKSPGLVLWHIDQNVVDSRYQLINSAIPHGVSVLQADGNQDLDRGANRGDRGDSYPGSSGNTRFSLTTTPAARDNVGAFLGFIIDSIVQLPNQAMRFRLTRRQPSQILPSLAGASVRVNDTLWPGYTDVIPGGDAVTVSADSPQSLLGGRTLATWLAWSNGGPRAQSFTSSLDKPDTLTAVFRADHRVQVQVQPGGLVSADLSGDPMTGILVQAGTPITLTAGGQTGFAFAGWIGDTTALAPALTLPMNHPYDLVANFVPEVAVAPEDATGALLGTATLTAAQQAFLDQLGNRNGQYDVGDYLAHLQRQALASRGVTQRRGGGLP